MIPECATPSAAHPFSSGSGRRDECDALAGMIEAVDSCPLCRSRQLTLKFLARDTLHGMPGRWGVVECDDCGLMHTSPRPSRDEIARFYPEDYQPHGEHFAPAARRDGPLKHLVRRLLDPKEVVIPDPGRPRRLLEVGCGSGRLLVQLADRGWRVEGLEPSAAAAATLTAHRDLPITVGTIEGAEFPRESFDVIVASMVLEHLHDPLHDLAKLRTWLRPGGHITGSVPNCASWEFLVFRENWFALQVPTHLFHYTPATLKRLLEEAGFHHATFHHQRNVSNLMIQLGRLLDRHGLPCATTLLEFPERGSRALRLAVRPTASILAWLGQAGRISFVAEKP